MNSTKQNKESKAQNNQDNGGQILENEALDNLNAEQLL